MDSTWTSTSPVARCFSLDETLHPPLDGLGDFRTVVLKRKGDARRLYDAVCVPLTTPAWRERWKRLCTTVSGIGIFAQDEMDNWMDVGEESEASTEVGEGKDGKPVVLKKDEEETERWRMNPVFLKGEVTMTALDEAEGVIGMVSDWLELDSLDEWVRHDAEIALKQELAYASYLGIQAVVLPTPRERSQAAAYGRTIRSCLESMPFQTLAIRLPLYDPSTFARKLSGTATASASTTSLSASPSPPSPVSDGTRRLAAVARATECELSGTWEIWDTIRSVCGYNPRLTIMLDLSVPLPSVPGIMSRWQAEPVNQIYLPASSFISNPKGYPVLPKATQQFLQTLMKTRPTIILSGADQRLHPRGTEEKYVDYIHYLEKSSSHFKRLKEANTLENYAQGFHDFLQMPLQPLQDHLGSTVYENFERDPVKYNKYEEAMYRALLALPAEQKIILCVAGAGRGPLVQRALNAIQRASRNAFVYVIEKNPNAFVTLQERQEIEWHDSVKLLFGDMRTLDVPEKADILISELLGSLGDNELSPECLDGAMRFLKEDGVSIPSSYCAFLAPISTSKLFNEAGGSKDGKDASRERSLETPYVVLPQSFNFLSGDGGGLGGKCGPKVQQCWEFEHPRKEAFLDPRGLPLTNTHNARSANMSFYIPHAGILHGYAGYFEAVLYGNIGLSIHPERKDAISKDMLSWFPLFFPIKEPLYLPSNSELRVSLWRLTGAQKVWYEWMAEAFLPVSSHVVGTSANGAGTQGSRTPPSASPKGPSNALIFNMTAPTTPPPHHRFRADAPVLSHMSPRVNGAGALVTPPTTYSAMPSPLLDALDTSFGSGGASGAGKSRCTTPVPPGDEEGGGVSLQVVKIGQTSLHNPGGRSSWVGL